ncbi:hypothetical protein ES708_06180 [subsurface metagenome]
MGRVPHKLRRNKQREFPREWLFFDCETLFKDEGLPDIIHGLKMGWACYARLDSNMELRGEEWFEFHTTKEFWDYAESKARKGVNLRIVAHNIQFDLLAVRGLIELPVRDWEQKKMIIGSNIFISKHRKDRRTITMFDSWQILGYPLKQIGEFVGIPKGEIDFDTCIDKELSDYCYKDVLILREGMFKWLRYLRDNDLGNFRNTVSGQALNAFKHRFMDQDVYIHTTKQAIELERASYRGGRTECFKLGRIEGEVHDLDVNSMYPFVMRENDYPVKLIRYIKKASVWTLNQVLNEYCAIARVRIKIDKPAIAVLHKRLMFPVGEFDVCLCTPELEWVLRNGLVTMVTELAVYEKAPVFREYVDELYALRQRYKADGDIVGDANTKLMLNGLYGKFGQRIRNSFEVGETDPWDIYSHDFVAMDTHERFTMKAYGGKVYKVCQGKDEASDAFPAVASHVTAYARMLLWSYIEAAGLDHVLYCDTDSIFVDYLGYKRLQPYIDPTRLGALKVERIAEGMLIHGPKDYEYAGVRRLKGVRRTDVEVEPGVFKSWRFLKLKSMIRRGNFDGPVQQHYLKVLKRRYNKGHVGRGGVVTPYVLPDDMGVIYPKPHRPGRTLPTRQEIEDYARELYAAR